MSDFEYPVSVEAPDRNITKMKATVELPDGRYHFWFNANTMMLSSGVLFKKPPTGVKLHDKGYFDCRRLNPNSIRNTKLIAATLRHIVDTGSAARVIENITTARETEQRTQFVKQAVRQYWADQMRQSPVCTSLVNLISTDEFVSASTALADKLSA